MSPYINYDTDIVKHYVRVHGWLPAVEHRSRRVGNQRSIKYLTFCASNAIDVFLLESEGYLQRDPETARLENVYFCERIPEDFGNISTLIGSSHQGFLGDFEDIVLFEDTSETQGQMLSDIGEPGRDQELRDQLLIKDAKFRLRDAFPFDVLNIDISGSFFPPNEPPASRMVQALREVLDWQTEASNQDPTFHEFTIFVTSKVANKDTNSDALDGLQKLIEENIDTYQEYSDAFQAKYAHLSVDNLRETQYPDFFVHGLCKVLTSDATSKHWDIEYRCVFAYHRSGHNGDGYHIVSMVAHLNRIAYNPRELVRNQGALIEQLRQRYVAESVETLTESPWIVDPDELQREEVAQIAEHLQSVVGYRERYRAEFEQ